MSWLASGVRERNRWPHRPYTRSSDRDGRLQWFTFPREGAANRSCSDQQAWELLSAETIRARSTSAMPYRSKQAPGLIVWLSQLMARTHQNVAVVALANKLIRMA
jgi:hypothetical protein